MRGIIDSPKFLPIGTLPDLTAEEIRGSRDMAGMLRAVAIKVSKSGQKFAIITVEDFTGSTEALLWGDSFTKAAGQEGLLTEGNFVQFRARISEDEKTGGKKVSANGLEQIGGSTRRRGGKPKHYEITLNTARHNAGDLELIKETLLKYPGKMPVHMHFRNSLGNRVSIELGERYCVTPCARLDEELSLYS